MFLSCGLLYCVFYLLSEAAAQSTCDGNVTDPVVFSIQNVTLGDGLVRRGIAMSLGTPPQNLAFLPYPGLNNTYIFDVDSGPGTCSSIGDSSTQACNALRGGLFNEQTSGSWATNSTIEASEDSQSQFNNTIGDTGGEDTLKLSASSTSPRLQVIIPGVKSDFSMNSLGLGRNATALNALNSARSMASTVWSVFWGSTGASSSSQQNGVLVMGGYDSGKTRGDNFTGDLSFSDSCFTGVLLSLSDLTLNLVNGTDISLLGSSASQGLRICVDASYPTISISQSMFNVLQSVTPVSNTSRSIGVNAAALITEASAAYTGSLTVALASGLNITIPNDQLVIPDQYIDQTTGVLSFNSNTRIFCASPQPPQDSGDVLILGRTFLTSAYLMVDYDKNQYTVWQANPSGTQDLVAVGPSSTCTTASSGNTTADSSSPSSSPTNLSRTQNGLSAGAKAGAAVGAVAVVGFLTLGAFILRRRYLRRQVPQNQPPPYLPNQEKTSTLKELPHKPQYHELPPPPPPHEIGDWTPHEMPGEAL